MNDLIKALQIFLKYDDSKCPTNCEHEMLYVGVDPALVSEDDIKELERLGFYPGEEDEPFFTSNRFGSY